MTWGRVERDVLGSTDVAAYMDAQQRSGKNRYNRHYEVHAVVVYLYKERNSHLKVLKGFLKLDPNRLLSLREWSKNKRCSYVNLETQ